MSDKTYYITVGFSVLADSEEDARVIALHHVSVGNRVWNVEVVNTERTD